MTEKEETKFCSNCESQIPISKFMLHERFCSSNVEKCPICKKPVIIEDMEDHNKEFHVLKECELCQKKFTSDKIEEHKKKCDCRMVECQYCEMQIQIKEKSNHEYMCGSKTEECPICRKLITKKDMKNHKKIGCKSPEEELLNYKNQNKNNYYDEIFERENRKRIKELEEKTRKIKNDDQNTNIEKITNNHIKIQNALPIEHKTPVSLPINDNNNKNNKNKVKENNNNKNSNKSKVNDNNNINNNFPVNLKSNINNISANNRKVGVASIKFGTNKYQYKSNSIAGNNENDNNMNNNFNNKNNKQQPIKANENILKGKLIDPNEEKDKNKNGLGKKQSKPSMNMKFGDKNSSKTNLLNSTNSSLKDTKSSFKFTPKIETKNNKLKNNINNNNIIKSSNKKVSSKPFGKINFDDGDFFPDDFEIGANFDDEKEIQEAIQRSLWQK